ncbi:MAG: signal transduction histidine kinase [Candidatus Aldehydirespiratoraceae bacterium]|jgi:signal transduction histidine kinase
MNEASPFCIIRAMESVVGRTGTGLVHRIRWIRTHPNTADMLLALVVTGVSVTFHWLGAYTEDYVRDPTWWTTVFVVASVFPLAWRRTNPVGSTLVIVTAQVVSSFVDIEGTGFIGVVIALYSLGAHATGPGRRNALVVIVASITLLFLSGLAVSQLGIEDFTSSIVVLVTGFVLGDNLQRRRETADALQEQLERAERERELIAHQRVTEERTRIARELHDVVAHSVSVMVIQAAAARRSLASSPANVEIALANIEATGRQTMHELRGVLGVLRRTAGDAAGQGEDNRAPQPTLSAIPGLVAAASDLPIELTINAHFGDVSQSTNLTGYRIVQEAITNIRRHAGPVTHVEISVDRLDTSIEILVADDGRGAAADDLGAGYGIVGMHERVATVGGRLDAGWRSGGGWRVTASLPAKAST